LFETSEPAPTLAGSLENGGARGTTRLSEGLSYNQRAVLAAIVTREILTAGAGSLLDIGAGPPEAAVPLAAQVETYLAVERDPRHALHLRQAGLSVGEATFPVSLGRSFDLVVSSHSIPEEDVSLYDAFVDAAWEAVRPGGVLLIITFKGPHGGLGALRTEVTGRKHGYAEYAALMTLLQGRGPIEEELVPSHAKSTDVADLTAFFAGWLFQSDAEARTGRRKLQDVLKRGYCRDGVYAVPTNHNVIRCRKLAQPRAVGEKVDALLAEEAR
jgi:hypothetical protein